MAVYGNFALKAMQDYFAGKTVKAMIVGTNYAPNVDIQTFVSNLPNGTEIAPSGSYPAGGVVVNSLVVTYDAATNKVKVDCDDITFPLVSSGTAYGVLFYLDAGAATANRLIGYDAYATPVPLDNSLLLHAVHADGILTLTV